MKTLPMVMTVLICGAVACEPAGADPSEASSEASLAGSDALAGSGALVSGAALVAGSAVVVAVHALGTGTELVLQQATQAGTSSLHVAGDISADLGVAAGTVVGVVAASTGYALLASGHLIAFVPNEVGRALVHTSRVTGRS